VAAHRDGDDSREIERAKTAIRKADEDLEFLAAETQGLAERAAVALQAVKNFEISDNERLMDELAPKAAEARDAVNAWIEQGRQVFADYDAVMTEASRLVSAVGKSPRQEGPRGHGLEQHIHALHQAVANRPVPLPMPDFAHTKFLAEQETGQARGGGYLMPFKRCMDCGQLVLVGKYRKHYQAHRGKQNRGWSARNRSDQRKFRAAVLIRDGHQCTFVENGLRCPVTEPVVAHHTVPLHKGGSFDPAGGVTLCELHHREVDRLCTVTRVSTVRAGSC